MSQSMPLHPSRWTFEPPKSSSKEIPDPPGFAFSSERVDIGTVSKSNASTRGILEKQAWDLALAPGKSIFMNIFMLWMMGTGSGIFSILMVGYAVMQSFSSLLRVNDGKIGVFGQKSLYVLINLAVLGYLCNHAANMGLFPINSGDWVASFPASSIPETSVRIP